MYKATVSIHTKETVGSTRKYKATDSFHMHETVGSTRMYKATGSIHTNETVGSTRKYTAVGSIHKNEVAGSTRLYKAIQCIVYYAQQKQKHDSYVPFLDIFLEIDINGHLSTRLYDKGDHLRDWSLYCTTNTLRSSL